MGTEDPAGRPEEAPRTRLGPLPVGELLHPAALLALAVLLANDWWGKVAFPGWLTGKLSDAAGLVVAPLATTAALGCVGWAVAARVPRVDPSLRRGKLVAAIAVVAAAFIAAKTSATAAAALARALALLGGHPRIVCDPSDLVTLPMLWVTWQVGMAELRLVPKGRVHAALRAPRAGWLDDVRAAGAPEAALERLDRATRELRDRSARAADRVASHQRVHEALRELAQIRR